MKIYYFTDGAGQHFKNKNSFANLAHEKMSLSQKNGTPMVHLMMRVHVTVRKPKFLSITKEIINYAPRHRFTQR